MTTKQPLPRYRVRKGGSRFYPFVVWDDRHRNVALSGFYRKEDAQREADYMNEVSARHDAIAQPSKGSPA
jgi:hypothetical protein